MAWRLIAIVASRPRGIATRSAVSETIWGNAKRGTLRKLLWDLRTIERRHGIRILNSDGSSVWLSDTLYVDVQDLLSEVPQFPLSTVYRGDYVEGLVSTVPAWTRWLAGERERLRDLYVSKATASLTRPGVRRSDAIREARHLLQVDPGAEAALRAEMVSDAIDGEVGRVRQNYHGLETRLHHVGRRPSEETRDLFVRLVGDASDDTPETPRGQDPAVPTICLSPPAASTPTAAYRLAQSLVVDVTIGLCRNSLLKIVAPHTAAQVRDLQAVVELGVSYLVTVDLVDHVAGHEQVVCTLLSVATRRVLWSDRIEVAERYSVQTYNLLTAGVLRSVMRHVDQATIEAYALKAEPSSYVDFLLGQASLTSLDLREIRRGRQHLRRAVDRSPSFAPSSSALARSYQLEWLLTARGDNEILARSQHYARAAVAVDPYEARGYRELGFCSLYSKEFDLSIEHYQTAERLNPHYADILADYADALIHDGQPLAAVEKIEKAIELNPLCQDTYFWTRGSAYLFLERYQDAIDSLKRMKDRTPVYRLLAAVYALSGNKEQASRCRAKAMELHPEMNLERWINIVPFRDPRQVQHYHEGLRLAGFQ